MSGRPEAGFTLIEVLVAFVIAAVLLTLAFEVVGAGFRAVGHAQERAAMAQQARSLLALAGLAGEAEIGRRQGSSAGLDWTIEVGPAVVPGVVDRPTPELRLVRVTVEVHPPGRPAEAVTLESLRLIPVTVR